MSSRTSAALAAPSPRRAARTSCSTPPRGEADPEGSVASRSFVGPALRGRPRGPRRPEPADPVVDGRGDQPVVVLGDEAVDPALEQEAEHGVEGVVRLAEVDLGAAVAHVL